MTFSHQDVPPCQWFSRLAAFLDRRSAPRLAWLFVGAVLARGRRTVTSWIRAAGLSTQFRPCYTTVAAAGKKTKDIAARLVCEVVKPLVADLARLTLAIDDTPTQRYGPLVQGAGIHHNPTPGPAGSPHVYGHIWVVLGLLAVHPAWGVIALPLLARMYVRAKDLPAIYPQHRPEFQTKLEMAVELLRWAHFWLKYLGKPLWVVVDGAYAKAPFLKPAMALGMTVVSRLRKDAALWTVPGPRVAGRRGRPRIYGENRIELAKRAGQRRGWTTEVFELYGKPAKKRYKTFVATWRPVGGIIRVVLVDEPDGWVAFFCTDPNATVAEILATVADRFAAGDHVPRLQGDRRSRPAAGAVRVGKHRCIPHLPLDVHDDRGLGLGPGRRRVSGPPGVTVGRSEPSPEPRGQASGLASRIAGRRNSRGSTPGGHRGGNSSRRRAVTRLGGLRVHSIAESTDLRKVEKNAFPSDAPGQYRRPLTTGQIGMVSCTTITVFFKRTSRQARESDVLQPSRSGAA